MVNGAERMLTASLRRPQQFYCDSTSYRLLCVLPLSLPRHGRLLSPLFFSISALTTLISRFSVLCVVPRCPPSLLFLLCNTHSFTERACEQQPLSSISPSRCLSFSLAIIPPLLPPSTLPLTVDNSVGQCRQCLGHTEAAG